MSDALSLRQVRKKGSETEATFTAKGPKLRRPRRAGDLGTLQTKLWAAVLSAEDLLFGPEASREEQVRAIHALVQAGQA